MPTPFYKEKEEKKLQYLDTKTLESWLKSAADLLRGSAEGMKYIITLLFYKRICDVYDDEVEEVKRETGLSEERQLKLIVKEGELTRFFIPKETHFDEVRKTTVNLGQRLTEALIKIAKENEKLRGVIDNIDFNATVSSHGERVRVISDDKIAKLLEVFSQYKIGLKNAEPDVLGRAYEYLIRLYAQGQGKTAGELYTPREVAFLMAYCLDAEEGEEIYDPACGSGGLLIKNHLVLKEKKEKLNEEIKRPLKLYGQEIIPTSYAIAKMNMFIHNIEETDIRLGDTLLNPAFIENNRLKTFDKVVANPMWNQKGYDDNFYDSDQYERFAFGYPTSSSADWGWVQHMFTSLKPKGKMAVVLDTGSVSRGSGERQDREKSIRQKFVEKDLIECVILLPENLFYNTGAPGIIMFISKNKPKERKGKILLINASKEFQKGKPKNFLGEENIKKITDIYHKFKEIEGLSKIITLQDAAEADYNLSPSRFVSIIEEEEHRPMEEITKELKQIEKEKQKVEEKIKGILRKLGN
ncbi:MAG: class I SAM-dependent DNA methyltransferase [Patescibacteria group bacterium]|nr:class I SAM-dependent DNA methyltransferase [Patescibacteria group bacterium]